MSTPHHGGWFRLGRSVFPHFSAAVLSLLATSCVTRTSYPADWPARGQGSGNGFGAVSGTYRNRGEIVDVKGGRHPVLLNDLLDVALEKQAQGVSDRLKALGQPAAAGSAQAVVVLEVGGRVDAPLQWLVPARYREDFESGREAAGKFLPDLRYFRWRVPPEAFRQTEGFVHPDGRVDVFLVNSQGWQVSVQLRRATDGSLVGQLKDEAAGFVAVVPLFFFRDSWVRFEPAAIR